MPSFPPTTRPTENLAAPNATVRLVPHHISKPRNAGLCGFWGLGNGENPMSRFRQKVHKTSTLIFESVFFRYHRDNGGKRT